MIKKQNHSWSLFFEWREISKHTLIWWHTSLPPPPESKVNYVSMVDDYVNYMRLIFFDIKHIILCWHIHAWSIILSTCEMVILTCDLNYVDINFLVCKGQKYVTIHSTFEEWYISITQSVISINHNYISFSDMLLSPTCKINYFNMQNNYVHIQHNHVNSGVIMLTWDLDYVTCQYINHVAVNINKSHVNIIMFNGDIIYFAGSGHKNATIHYTC